jgi:beta-glucosidase/6-phospho-beta-glucosidase/beta-galactosidase
MILERFVQENRKYTKHYVMTCTENTIFKSYFMGGFECSSSRLRRGRRLDLIASTRHEEFAKADYQRLVDIGMKTARDGLRWHLIETEPGRYDFTSIEAQAGAMRQTGISIIWDLFHYGYPDDIDIFSEEFPHRFAAFSAAAAEYLASLTDGPLMICPVNEISFFSWVAGEIGKFHPFARKRGHEMKRQLIKATVASIDAVRSVAPETRFIQIDPAINVIGSKKNPKSLQGAADYHESQFHAFDMACGLAEPELGGDERYLDIIGLNYYVHNQWRYPNRRKIPPGHDDYKPLRSILAEYFERYRRPILLAETGIEDDERPGWFRYVAGEVLAAISDGVPVQGICLYPIVNHPGWDDDRHCHNGLWDYIGENDEREVYQPLADEVMRQVDVFNKFAC